MYKRQIYDGALAIGGIFDVGRWVWCLVIGALILLWIVVGITDLGWINKITMAALFVLTLVLCKVIFFSGSAMAAPSGEGLTFGAAVEMCIRDSVDSGYLQEIPESTPPAKPKTDQ